MLRSLTNEKLSLIKVENVVKEPIKPTESIITNLLSKFNPITIPIKIDPMIFIVIVADGK